MNKIYKVIYNKNKHRYEVVSELAKSHGGKCKTTVATAGDTNWLRRLWMRVRGGVNKSDEDGNPVTMSISRAAMVALMCISVWSAAAVSSSWVEGASAEGDPVSVKYDEKTGTIKIIKTDPNTNDETIVATYAVGGSITPIIDNGEKTVKNTIALGQNSTVLQSNTIAIGTDAHAGNVGGSNDTSGRIAIGTKTVASGNRSIALGNYSTENKGSYNIVQGSDSIGIGTSTSIFGYSGVSIGRRNIIGVPDPDLVKDGVLTTKSKTTYGEGDLGGNSVIVGAYNVAYGNRSNVIGTYSRAMGSNSVAIGSGVQSLSNGSIAIGKGSGYEFEDGSRFKNGEDVTGDFYGRDWELPPEYKVLKQVLSNDINGDTPYKKSNSGRKGKYKYENGGSLPKYNNYGAGSSDPGGFIVEGENALGIGTYTQVRGDSAIGLATGEMTADLSDKDKSAYARAMRKIMDMEETLYDAKEALQAGTGDTATLESNVKAAEKSLATAKKDFRDTYLKKYSFVDGNGALGVGRQILAQGDRSMAVGDYAKAISSDAIAYGGQTLANGTNSMAMGGKAHVGTEKDAFANSMAIGSHTNVQAGNAVALGAFSQVTGQNSLALGFGKQTDSAITYNSVSGKDSTLIGSYGTIQGNNSILIGSNGNIANDRVVGLGNNINIKAADQNDQENNTAGSVFLGDHAGYVKDSKRSRSLGQVDVVGSAGKMELTESLSSTKGALRDYTKDFIYIYMLERQDDGTQIGAPIAVRSDFAGGDSTVGVVSVGSTYEQKFNSLQDIKDYHTKVGSLITVPVDVTVQVTKNGVPLGEQQQTRYFAADSTRDTIYADNTLSEEDKAKVWNTIQKSISSSDTTYTVFETRRIQNVAPGLIGLNSTDAINGSQLFATNQMLGNLVGSLKKTLGDSVTVSEDGQITVAGDIDTLGWIAKAGTVGGSNGTVAYDADKKTGETEEAYQARIAKLKEDGYIVDASKVMTFKAGKNIGLVQKPGEFSISTIDTPSFTSVELRGETKEVNGSQVTPVTMMDSSGMQVYTETVTPDGSGSTTTKNVSTTVNNEGVTTDGTVKVTNGEDGGKDLVSLGKGSATPGETDQDFGTIHVDGKQGADGTITIDRGTKSMNDKVNLGTDPSQDISDTNTAANMDRITYTTKGPNNSTINHEVATLDDGFFLTTSKDVTDDKAAAKVKLNNTIKFTDGANTKVSNVESKDGVHSLHIDVNGLPVVYTDEDGNKLTKVGDKFYKDDQFDNGTLKSNATPSAAKNISIVNPDGSISKTDGSTPTTVNNVGSAIGGDVNNGAPKGSTINGEPGNNSFIDNLNKVGGTGNDAISKNAVVTTGDLKNLADTSLFFSGDAADGKNGNGKNTFGRKLSEEAKIVGGVTTPANLTDNNIGVVSNGSDTLTVKLAKNLKDLDSTTYTSDTTATDDGDTKSSMKVDGNGVRFVEANGDTVNNTPTFTTDGITGGNKTITDVASGIGGEVKDAAHDNANTFLENVNKIGKEEGGQPAADAISENVVVNAKDLKNLVDTGFKLNTSGQPANPGADTIKIGDTINIVDGMNTKVSAIDDSITGTHTFHIDVTGMPISYTDGEGNALTKIGDNYYKNTDIEDGKPKDNAVAVPADKVTNNVKVVNKDGGTTEQGSIGNVKSVFDSTIGNGGDTGSQIDDINDANKVEKVPGTNKFIKDLTTLKGDTPADKEKLNSVSTVGDLQKVALTPLFFEGDTADGKTGTDGKPHKNTFGRKLSETAKIIGGQTDVTKLTDGNIGVVSNGSDTLTIKLAKELKDLDSVKVSNGKDGDDAKDLVTIGKEVNSDAAPGTDGENGTIGLNGKNGSEAVITIDRGTKSMNDKVNLGTDPSQDISGTNTAANMDRITYTTKGPNNSTINHEVATLDDGFFLTTSKDVANKKAAAGVKLNDTIQFNDGTNTKVSTVTSEKGVHELHIDVSGLPVSYTDTDGDAVTKIGDKYYKSNQVVDGKPIDGATEVPADQVTNNIKVVNTDGTTNTPGTISNVASGIGGEVKDPAYNNENTFIENIKKVGKKNDDGTVAPDAISENVVVNAKDLKKLVDTGFKLNTSGQPTDPGATTVKIGETINVVNGVNTKVSAITTSKDGVHEFHIDVTGMPISYTDTDGNALTKIGDNYYKNTEITNGVPNKDAVAVDPEKVTDNIKVINKDGSTTNPGTISNVKSAIDGVVGNGAPNGSTINGEGGTNTFIDNVNRIGADTNGIDKNSVVTTGDLKNLADTSLFFSGDAADGKNGNVKNTFGRKLSEEAKIVGGVTTPANLTDNNIGVVSNGSDTLTIKLAKQLTGLDSATYTSPTTKTDDGDATSTMKVDGNGIRFVDDKDTVKTDAPSLTTDGIDGGNKQITNIGSGFKNGTTSVTIDDIKNPSDALKDSNVWNNAVNVGDLKNIIDTGFKLNTSGQPTKPGASTVKIGDTINIIDGANTKVSAIDDSTTGTHTFHIDVNGLPMSYVDSDGNPLTKIGDKFYKTSDLVNGVPPVGTAEVLANKVTNNVSMLDNTGSHIGVAPQIKNVGSGLVDNNGKTIKPNELLNMTDANNPVLKNAVNVGDLKQVAAAAKTEVTGTGKAIVTQTEGDDGHATYNVHVDPVVDVVATDGKTPVVRGDDGKYYNPTDIADKTFVSDGKGGGSWYNKSDIGPNGKPNTDAPVQNIGPVDVKNNFVNPNGTGSIVLDNVKSGIGGEVEDAAGNNTFIKNINKVGKKNDDGTVAPDAISENTVVNAKDLKNVVDTGFKLNTSGQGTNPADTVKVGDTIQVVDGKNTTVSAITHPATGVHEFHIDVTGLPVTYTAKEGENGQPVDVSKVGDNYQLADGTKLVKYGDKFYKPNQIVNGQPVGDAQGFTINDDIRLVNPNNGTGPVKITNVAPGVGDTDAVNMSQLKTLSAGSKTEVTGTGAAEVTKKTAKDGHDIYNVHVDKLLTVKPVTPGTPMEHGADGKYYAPSEIQDKIFVSDGNGGGSWYAKDDVDKYGTPLDGKSPLAEQPTALDPNTLKTSVTNPNGNGPTIVDNVKSVLDGSGIGNGADMSSTIDAIENGKRVDKAGSNQFIKDLTGLNPTTDADKLNSVSTVSDLQKVALTPLFFEGDTAKDATTNNAFGRKLSEKAKILGGQKDVTKLTDNNIGVVSNGSDTLTIKLAKELQDLTSVTTVDETNGTKTIVSGKGVTTDGKVVVNNGKTGDEAKEFVTIDKGTDGSGTDKEYGKIGLDGKNGSNATITIDRGTESLNDDVNIGVDPSQPVSETNKSATMDRITYTTTGPNNTVINHEVATLDDGFFLTTSKDVTDNKAAAKVKLNNTIKFTDGANTKVSTVDSKDGIHELHVDVTGLPVTYTASELDDNGKPTNTQNVSKVGDTYQLEDGTKLVKVDDKYYTPDQLDNGTPKPGVKGLTIDNSIRVINPEQPNSTAKITNVAPGEADTDAVNMSQLKQKVAAATTEVTGTGAAEVTKVTGADGQNIYNVHVDKLMTVKPVDANTNIARGGDGKYYNADDIAGKTFVSDGHGGGNWYDANDVDQTTGKPKTEDDGITLKQPLEDQPQEVDQNMLKNSVVNPNGDGPTVLDNVKSGIGGDAGNGIKNGSTIDGTNGNNTFIEKLDKVGKPANEGGIDKTTVVNAGDLKNLADTPLFFSGDSADGEVAADGTDKNTFSRKLSQETKIVGGVELGVADTATATERKEAIAAKLTDGNIGVISDGTNKLTVKLAKELTDLTSVTTGSGDNTTTMTAGGTTTTSKVDDIVKTISTTPNGMTTTEQKVDASGTPTGESKTTTVTPDGVTVTTGTTEGQTTKTVLDKDGLATDGKVVVTNGKDGDAGKELVTIDKVVDANAPAGTDGEHGQIGLDGKNGSEATITIDRGTKSLADGKNIALDPTKPVGENNPMSMDRITYATKGADGSSINHEVATMDDGFLLTTSGDVSAAQSPAKVAMNHTITIVDGANTKVSKVTTDSTGAIHELHIDVNGLPTTYVDGDGKPITKVGDSYVDADGETLVKVGDAYYRKSQLNNPDDPAAGVKPGEQDKGVTFDVKLVSPDGITNAPKLNNVGSSLVKGDGTRITMGDLNDSAAYPATNPIWNSAVNVGDLKAASDAAKTEVTGTGAADVTKLTAADGHDVYNVHVDKLMTVTATDPSKTIKRGGDGKYYNEGDIDGKTFVPNGQGGGNWYNSTDVDQNTGKPLAGKNPLPSDQAPQALNQNELKNSIVNPNGDDPTVLDNAKSGIGGAVKDADKQDANTFLENVNKIGKKDGDQPTADAISENVVVNAKDLKNLVDTGFKLNTSGQGDAGASTVKIGDTINVVDGANTKVSAITSTKDGTHTFHIDVTGLPMTYTAAEFDGDGKVVDGSTVNVSKVGDTYQTEDGTKLVNVGGKYYKPKQLDSNGQPKDGEQGLTVTNSISLQNPNSAADPATLKNVGSGLKDANGNPTSIDKAVGSNAVNVDDLRTMGKAATTEVTGSGAAEVTKVKGADGQNIYNVHVDKLMTVKPVDANTDIARGGDGKYYDAKDIAGKTFVPSENKWYNTADVDENTGKPLKGKTPLDNQPTAVDQNKLKNSVVNPNGDGPTVLDNVKSGIGGKVVDPEHENKNTFIENINKVGKKNDDGTVSPDAISENTVVNAKDLKNVVDTGFKLNTSGHSGDAQTVKIGDTINIIDGANTKVSAIDDSTTGTHTFHIDVTGLPVTYTATKTDAKGTPTGEPVDVSKVGDSYQLADGTKLVKVDDKYYTPDQLDNGKPKPDVEGLIIKESVSLTQDNSAPATLERVGSGRRDGMNAGGDPMDWSKILNPSEEDKPKVSNMLTNAANIGDVRDAIKSITDGTSDNASGGFGLTGNNGDVKQDLGKTITVKGGIANKFDEAGQDLHMPEKSTTDQNTYVNVKDVPNADGNGTHKEMVVEIAKDLTDLDSVTVGNVDENGNGGTVINKDGMTVKDATGNNSTSIGTGTIGTSKTDKDGNTSSTNIDGGTITSEKKDKDGNKQSTTIDGSHMTLENKDKDGKLTGPKTEVSNEGMTITPVDKDGNAVTDPKKQVSITDKGLNNGGNQIINVDSGLKDTNGSVKLKDATGDMLNNAVNVGDLKEAINNAQTAVDGDGAAEISKSVDDNGRPTYKVHVDKLVEAKADDGKAIVRGEDNKFYYKDESLKQGKDGKWYPQDKLDADGNPEAGAVGKNIPILGTDPVPADNLKTSLVNPNDPNSKVKLDNIKSAIGGDVGNGAGSEDKVNGADGTNSFIDNLDKVGKKDADGNLAPDGIADDAAVTTGDLKNLADTPLFFGGDSADGESTDGKEHTNAFDRKLGKQINIKGEVDLGLGDNATAEERKAAIKKKLSDGNIGVISNGKDTLTVKLSKDLKDLNTIEVNDSVSVGKDGDSTVIKGAETTSSFTEVATGPDGQPLYEVDEKGEVVRDSNGDPVPVTKTSSTTTKGGTVTIKDSNVATGPDGKPLYKVDEKGNPVLDEKGHKIPITESSSTTTKGGITESVVEKAEVDGDKPLIDENGNPIMSKSTTTTGGGKLATDVEKVKMVDGKPVTSHETTTIDGSHFESKDKDGNYTTINGGEIKSYDKDTNGSVTIKGDSLTASSKDENGHDKVTEISSDGFNSTATAFERDGNGQIVRNPDTGLPKEVTNSTNINSDGFTATRTDSEGNEVLKTTMQNGNIAIEKPQPIIDPTTGEAYKVLDKDGNWVPAHGYTKISDNGFEIQGINQSGTGISKVKLSSEGLDNGGNRITHVAEGVAPDDAVNVSQLRGLTQNINNDIANVGANAAALAGLKAIQYDPLEPTQIMAAVGTYRGKQAAALGIAHYKNEDTMFHMGVSIGSDHTMANVGVTYKFGRTDEKKAVPDRYKAGPISSTYVLQDEMVALKEENARMRANDEKMNAAYDEILDLVKQLKQDNEEMKKKLEKLEKK